MRTRHVSVVIHRRADEVYDLAGEPCRLPEWAAGLATGTATVDRDELVVDSPMGRIRVRFVARNGLGVLDHEVTLPDGTRVHNPLRVLPHPEGAEVVFSVRQLTDDDDEFDRDCAMVAADLRRLRGLAEGTIQSGPPVVSSRSVDADADAVIASLPAASAPARIRIASPADADSVGRLLHDFNAEFDCPSPTPEVGARRFDGLLRREDVLVVVAGLPSVTSGDGDMSDIGFALLTLRPTPYWDGPLAQLEDLYVSADHRSGGAGSALLERAVAEVRSRGGEELHVNVDSDDTGARRFYDRHGFTDIDPDSGSGMRFYLRQL